MAGGPSDPLFDPLERIKQRWPAGGWTWDSRLSCVSSSFGTETADEARAAAMQGLPTVWDHRSLGRAPDYARDIAEIAGGVRPGQLIFTGNPVGRVVAYGLWWPWNDEQTTSFRIGIGGDGAVHEEFRLRDLFNALE